ncbi:hypothetical protein O3S80_02515 [Streptomyces sp. Lzd4kr]|nr:hypothetical protein [Streptomyces sp. Lzd4kr]
MEAARKARRERSREHAAGRGSRVTAEPAAEHAAVLRTRGLSAQDIASRSGLAVTLIRRLLRPAGQRPSRIARTTAEAVLGVPLPPMHHQLSLAGRGFVDAAPSARLLNDLAARGWPATRLARNLCVHPHTVSAIRDGRHVQISIAIEQRIVRVHLVLRPVDPVTAGVPPADAARARTWATRRADKSVARRRA